MGLVIAVLGLGEAGGALAADLAAGGAEVRGWDPRPDRGPRAASAPDAVRGSDVVLSVNDAGVAVQAAREVADELRDGQVYADLNTAGAPLKRELAGVVAPTGALFADVALMAPVPGTGVRTPALASGPGAEAFAARLAPLGMPVEVIGPEPGEAATRKLLRSVFMKGLAATCLESLAAARAAGSEDWMREEIASVLTGADGALLERLETGSRRHAARRVAEMDDATSQLDELGVPARVSRAARAWLEELRDA
jgi:3-hydroxyisobutyrate dehydrogenase-like beta-hydroxyacid dehydrogenase